MILQFKNLNAFYFLIKKLILETKEGREINEQKKTWAFPESENEPKYILCNYVFQFSKSSGRHED